MEDMNGMLARMQETWLPVIMQYGGRLLLALLTLVIGWWLVGKLTRGMLAVLTRRGVEPTLHGFLGSLLGIVLNKSRELPEPEPLGRQKPGFFRRLLGGEG